MKPRTVRKKASRRKPSKQQVVPPEAPKPQPAATKRALWRIRNVHRLVRAIFSANDPVEVATSLLKCKSDATRARIFAMLFDYLYGKPVQQMEASGPEGEKVFQFVTYAPRPQHQLDSKSEDQTNKEACRQSLASPVRAARPNVGNITQEDENDEHQ